MKCAIFEEHSSSCVVYFQFTGTLFPVSMIDGVPALIYLPSTTPFYACLSKGVASTILHLWLGAARIRTHDLPLQKQVLYQLSYQGCIFMHTCTGMFHGRSNTSYAGVSPFRCGYIMPNLLNLVPFHSEQVRFFYTCPGTITLQYLWKIYIILL